MSARALRGLVVFLALGLGSCSGCEERARGEVDRASARAQEAAEPLGDPAGQLGAQAERAGRTDRFELFPIGQASRRL